MRALRAGAGSGWWAACLALVLGVAGCAKVPPLVTRPPGPAGATVIQYVSIFDGTGAARSRPRDVLINGERISRIADPGTITTPATWIIDGRGKTLLPGLIDVHGHTGGSSDPAWTNALPDPERNLQSYLYSGVTTVLDPGGLIPATFERRDAIASGEVLGPHLFAAGPLFTIPGGHPVGVIDQLVPWWLRWYLAPRFVREVGTEAEARAAVRALVPQRPDVIKVVVDAVPSAAPILGGDVLAAIVDEARANGLRTVAHIGTIADALVAADAGVAAWMHGVYKERIPDETIPRFVEAGIPYVATSVVFDAYADVSEGVREATALERQTVAAEVLAGFAPVPADYDPGVFTEFIDLLSETREARCDNVRRLHAAGVTILAGADAQAGVFPGPGLHRELVILVRCGLTPAEALTAATADAARFLADSPSPTFGIVAEGKVADLLLVEGDPTRDIEAVSRILEVFQRGARLGRHPVSGEIVTHRHAGARG